MQAKSFMLNYVFNFQLLRMVHEFEKKIENWESKLSCWPMLNLISRVIGKDIGKVIHSLRRLNCNKTAINMYERNKLNFKVSKKQQILRKDIVSLGSTKIISNSWTITNWIDLICFDPKSVWVATRDIKHEMTFN